MGPYQGIAPRLDDGLGKRRAPRTRSDDADRLNGHLRLIVSRFHTGSGFGRRVGIERPPCTRRKIELIGQTARQTLRARPRHHGSIIRAKRGRWHMKRKIVFLAQPRQSCAQRLVCRDTARNDKIAVVCSSRPIFKDTHRRRRAVDDHVAPRPAGMTRTDRQRRRMRAVRVSLPAGAARS